MTRPLRTITCPKCQKTSGDSWRQCGGLCPMKGSPHYVGRAYALWVRLKRLWISIKRLRYARVVIAEPAEYDPVRGARRFGYSDEYEGL